MTPSETPRKKDDRYGYFTYDELKEHLGLPDKAVILQKSVCLGCHQWRLETEGPEVFVAVCSVCGKRTMDPGVLLKLLDDFSPRRRRWMR